MIIEHIGLSQINGSLIVLDNIKDASYDEMVELRLEDGSSRTGRIVEIEGEKVVNGKTAGRTSCRICGK